MGNNTSCCQKTEPEEVKTDFVIGESDDFLLVSYAPEKNPEPHHKSNVHSLFSTAKIPPNN